MEISMRRADDSRHVDGITEKEEVKRPRFVAAERLADAKRMTGTWLYIIGAKRRYWSMQDRWWKIPKKRREHSHEKFWSIRQLVHIGWMMENFDGAHTGKEEGRVNKRGLYKLTVWSIVHAWPRRTEGSVVCDGLGIWSSKRTWPRRTEGSVVCDGWAIWISKCALQIELRCGRFVWNLLVIVVFESGISLANKLQLDSHRGKAIV